MRTRIIKEILINDISEILGINSMSVVKFNYSVLDRIADYEVTKLNKFRKKDI